MTVRDDAPWHELSRGFGCTDLGVTHEVVRLREWSNPHGAVFVDLVFRCKSAHLIDPATAPVHTTTGTHAGFLRDAGGQDRVYRKMACRSGCWPHLRR